MTGALIIVEGAYNWCTTVVKFTALAALSVYSVLYSKPGSFNSFAILASLTDNLDRLPGIF